MTSATLTPRERALAARHAPSLGEALAAQLRPSEGGFKVGLELCTPEGALRVVEAGAANGGSSGFR